MKALRPHIIFILLLALLWSCKQPNLDGHYHLVWNNKGQQFQTWNIRNNRMVINDTVCQNPDSCFASVISFKRNVITIDPWVDNTFSAYYIIDDQGSVMMYGDRDTLWLTPHHDCLSSKKYFSNKTRHITSDFHSTDKISSSTGVHRFANTFENELIIGGESDSVFYIFNDKAIHESDNGLWGFSKVDGQTVWLHVDRRTPLRAVAPIIAELFENGYLVQYATVETNENDEQIIILERPVVQITKHDDRIEIETCLYCEKYQLETPDQVVSVKMLGVDLFVMNGDTNDLFQTRNSIVRYIGQNWTSRLFSQIQIEINEDTPFSDYLVLVDELLWIHIEVSSITSYKGKDDDDRAWIREKQENREGGDVSKEFPIRVKEIIN